MQPPWLVGARRLSWWAALVPLPRGPTMTWWRLLISAPGGNFGFHVDGAHGGAVAFCSELAERLRGVAQADSIILDYHKMMMAPALATAVIFRERQASWAAFHQACAEYLYDEAAGEEWHKH